MATAEPSWAAWATLVLVPRIVFWVIVALGIAQAVTAWNWVKRGPDTSPQLVKFASSQLAFALFGLVAIQGATNPEELSWGLFGKLAFCWIAWAVLLGWCEPPADNPPPRPARPPRRAARGRRWGLG